MTFRAMRKKLDGGWRPHGVDEKLEAIAVLRRKEADLDSRRKHLLTAIFDGSKHLSGKRLKYDGAHGSKTGDFTAVLATPSISAEVSALGIDTERTLNIHRILHGTIKRVDSNA